MNNVIKIGKQFTPSVIKEFKTQQGVEITVTAGGGMGGSLWTYYSYEEDFKNKLLSDLQYISFKTIDDEEITINKNYLVNFKPVNLTKMKLLNMGNTYIKSGNITYIFKTSINDSVVKTEESSKMDNQNCKLVLQY